MASNDATNAIDNFQPITNVIGTPTFKAINSHHKILKQNTISVVSTLAGGNHSLLALVLNNAKYTALTGDVWIKPINPSLVLRPIILNGATCLAQKNTKNEFESWKMVQDVREAIKKQI